MTKREKQIIRKELKLCYRCVQKNFWIDNTSDEYKRSLTKLVQLEVLAVSLCPKNSSVSEYFGWNEETKAEQRSIVERWRKESMERRIKEND